MMLPKDFETTRRFLEEYDRVERPFRAKWRVEVLGKRVRFPSVKISANEFRHLVTVEEEIQRCWFETGWCYTYGLFQAATLLASIVAELCIERYLRSKGLWEEYRNTFKEESKRTFGSLIAFARDRGPHLTPTILMKCDELNKRKIEAAHMNRRRNLVLTVQNRDLDDIDEIENVSQPSAEKPSEKEAFIALGEPRMLFDPRKEEFYKVRAFKKYANESVGLAAEISEMVFQLG
jgi:hypothetical protein